MADPILFFSVPLFYESIRAYILHVMGISFQKIFVDVLGPYVRLEGKDLMDLVGHLLPLHTVLWCLETHSIRGLSIIAEKAN